MSIFNEVINRRQTRSAKWDRMEFVYNLEDASNILPMWVADMDFAIPQPITDALKERLEHPVFGYSYVCDGCIKAIVHWYESRYNWTIAKQSFLFHHGVVPAMATIIETFTKNDDKVAISTPVYPPFFNITENMGREIVMVDLAEEDGIYSYDFNALENAFKNGVKLYILCNPHNPGGKVWSKEDLQYLINLCIQYDVVLLADEIHADITYGARYTPVYTLPNAQQAKIVACIAPTKTFNIAGVQAAMMVTDNKEMFDALQANMNAHGNGMLNAFASTALQAAYTHCEPWLEEMLTYISANMDYVIEQLNALDGIKVRKPEGTYLLWIDYRGTGLSEQEIMDRLLNIGQLALEPGTKYSETGRGFLRMNVACSLETVKDGVERFKKALH